LAHFAGLEQIEQLSDAVPESVGRAVLGFAQVGFELGDGLLAD
jgi:hypothetical protein